MHTGVAFPEVGGRRSTSGVGRAVIADALREVDPALAAQVLAEQDWHRGYLGHFRELTVREATVPGAAGAIAAAGLASVAEHFRFHTGGRDLPLAGAMHAGLEAVARVPALHTATVTGQLKPGPDLLAIPIRGRRLVADELVRQLDDWQGSGIVEPSFADAVRAVMRNPGWLDLRDLTVVVLGAGAEMGPLESLLRWGAHVVAVDLPSYDLWRRLLATAHYSPGRLSVPVSRWLPDGTGDDEIAAAAGVDVIGQAPELLGWLAELTGPFTLGNYVYADGPDHVLASVAVDAICTELGRLRGDDLSLAFLATPTDVFCVPEQAVQESRRRFSRRGPLRRLGRLGSAGNLFAANYPRTIELPDGREAGINDSLVPQQGANYALAKRIQRWRALHERLAGRRVSINVAAATRTRSVIRNRVLAAGYLGAHRFGVEVFEPETSNTLMAALLVHDLRNPLSVSDPAAVLGHPAELLWSGANHGGLWRTAFAPRSVLGVAVLVGMVRRQG